MPEYTQYLDPFDRYRQRRATKAVLEDNAPEGREYYSGRIGEMRGPRSQGLVDAGSVAKPFLPGIGGSLEKLGDGRRLEPQDYVLSGLEGAAIMAPQFRPATTALGMSPARTLSNVAGQVVRPVEAARTMYNTARAVPQAERLAGMGQGAAFQAERQYGNAPKAPYTRYPDYDSMSLPQLRTARREWRDQLSDQASISDDLSRGLPEHDRALANVRSLQDKIRGVDMIHRNLELKRNDAMLNQRPWQGEAERMPYSELYKQRRAQYEATNPDLGNDSWKDVGAGYAQRENPNFFLNSMLSANEVDRADERGRKKNPLANPFTFKYRDN